jgi:tetratricopeptide (TPR) repeat protein
MSGQRRPLRGRWTTLPRFTQAIVLDPSFAKAYAGLADCYNLILEYTAMPEEEAFPRAYTAASKAVELDPNLAEAHRALAFPTFWWKHDVANAEREFERAIALNPNDRLAHLGYANALTYRVIPHFYEGEPTGISSFRIGDDFDGSHEPVGLKQFTKLIGVLLVTRFPINTFVIIHRSRR